MIHRKAQSITYRMWFSTEFTASQIATLVMIGVTVIITTILSTFNLSSFIIIWMIFNHMRMLILMLLTEAYFPTQVNNYLVRLKLFSFNLSFLSIQNMPGLNEILKLFDYPQSNAVLQDLGLESQSTLVNNINLVFTLIMIMITHLM